MKFLIIVAIVSLLASCANHNERKSKVQGGIGVTGSNISVGIERLKNGNVVDNPSSVDYIVDDYWVDPSPIITAERKLNPIFNRRFSLVTATKVSIEKLSQDIGMASGVNFTLAPEVIHGLRLSESFDSNTSEKDDKENSKGSSKSKDLKFITELRASWVNARLLDVINQLTSQLNISWKFDDATETVHLYKYRSHTYDVHLPGENIDYKSSMTNESLVSGDGSSSVSGSAISTDVTITTDPWVGLTKRLDVIVTEGGRFSTDRASFKVTLTDTDEVHEQFVTMLNDVQRQSLQQIVFDVSLLTLTGNQRELYGINFDAIYENTVQASLATVRPADAALSMLAAGVDKSTDSHIRRATAFMDALSNFGQAAIVHNYQRSTLNNQVTSIMQARNRPYLRNVSIPVQGSNFNQNGQASLTDLVTGFSLSIRPHMINEDEMLVSLTINRRSAPNDFESVDAGAGIFLERPDIQDDSEFQQFIISDNQTKIISGSINEQNQADTAGTVDRDLWWLGGSSGHSQTRRMMVLFITARVI
jgi:hypothetical protein